MESVETEGATVEQAVEAALSQLGRRADEVEVEVLTKGSKGFFGLGASVARIKVTLKTGGILPPEALGRASEYLVRIIKLMGMDVEVEAKQHGNELYLEVDQGAGGILIGRRGSTLAALSTIMERVVNRGEGVDVKVFVDVAGYLERRRRALVTMAAKVAEEVRATGRPVQLEAMSAFERKVIHTALHHDKTVRTFSRGEGADRAVVVCKPGQEEPGSGHGEGGRGESRGGPRGHGEERGGRGGRWGGGDRGGRGGGRGGRAGGRGGFQGRPSMDDMPPPLEREGEIGDESAFDGGPPAPQAEGGPAHGGRQGNWRGPRHGGNRGGRGGGRFGGGGRGGRGGRGFGGNRGGGGVDRPAGGGGESGPVEGA